MTHFRYWQKNSHSLAKNPLGLLTHLPKHSDTSSQQTPKQKYGMKTLQAKNGGGFVYRMSSIIAVETRRKCGCVCLLLYSLLYVENIVKNSTIFYCSFKPQPWPFCLEKASCPCALAVSHSLSVMDW